MREGIITGLAAFAERRDSVASSEVHTPTLISPPGTKTPPTATSKRPLLTDKSNGSGNGSRGDDRGSEPVDPDQLNKALERFEQAGRQREHTPGSSPSRKRQRIYGDRFIPNRSGQDLQASYNLLHEDGSPATPLRATKRPPHNELHFQRTEEANRTYSSLLRSEMFDSSVPQTIPQYLSSTSHDTGSGRHRTPPTASTIPAPVLTPSTPHKNLFSFAAPHHLQPTPSHTPRSQSRHINMNARSEIYSLSPVKYSSQTMLLSPRKTPRAVSKVPYKVLDAPDLADDFYLNLVDWGSSGILAVGLGSCVYLWNSGSGKVVRLCELEGETVTSVGWIQRGTHLAVGTSRGVLLIYDTVTSRRLRLMTGHSARIGSLAWNAHILTSGSRDRTILHRDVRSPSQYLSKLVGHKQEVCGLRWNADVGANGMLASGGNDNKVMVWDGVGERALFKWGEQEGGHKAAVKAIAWSPHQRGLLASGGGTADRTIKFWNTIAAATPTAVASPHPTYSYSEPSFTGFADNNGAYETERPSAPPNPHLLSSYDTGSQVGNLLWSLNTNELVSTHGYSQNAIVVWKYRGGMKPAAAVAGPPLEEVVSLTGHTYRVLYLAMSPEGD
ncbi:substrate-specific activator of APC-dependent proteolysis, partial [Cryomyces antarcticus]